MTEQHVINYNITDAALAELAEKYQYITAHHDYKQAKAAAKECQVLRKGLEEKRVELKQDALRWGQKVDGEARRIKDKIAEVEDPIRATIKEVDEAEQVKEEARISGIQAEIEVIRWKGQDLDEFNLSQLRQILVDLRAIKLDSSFEEFLAEAEGAKAESESRLNLAINRAIVKEEEEARLEKQRLEQEATQKELDEKATELDRRAEEQRKEQVAQAAEQQKKIDAENERKRIELEKRNRELAAEKQKVDDEKRAKEEAEQAEIDRLRKLEEAPDVEKLKLLANSLTTLPLPTMHSDKGEAIVANVSNDLAVTATIIIDAIGEME